MAFVSLSWVPCRKQWATMMETLRRQSRKSHHHAGSLTLRRRIWRMCFSIRSWRCWPAQNDTDNEEQANQCGAWRWRGVCNETAFLRGDWRRRWRHGRGKLEEAIKTRPYFDRHRCKVALTNYDTPELVVTEFKRLNKFGLGQSIILHIDEIIESL